MDLIDVTKIIEPFVSIVMGMVGLIIVGCRITIIAIIMDVILTVDIPSTDIHIEINQKL